MFPIFKVVKETTKKEDLNIVFSRPCGIIYADMS